MSPYPEFTQRVLLVPWVLRLCSQGENLKIYRYLPPPSTTDEQGGRYYKSVLDQKLQLSLAYPGDIHCTIWEYLTHPHLHRSQLTGPLCPSPFVSQKVMGEILMLFSSMAGSMMWHKPLTMFLCPGLLGSVSHHHLVLFALPPYPISSYHAPNPSTFRLLLRFTKDLQLTRWGLGQPITSLLGENPKPQRAEQVFYVEKSGDRELGKQTKNRTRKPEIGPE